ncbi:unnamed protein product [Linum trigynum]|uniref:DUF4219 domain-containing protein n=1 Tax=Linum trigynum TaxID=586398 RepID=A0AAV2GH39_9ROSI
MATTSSNTMFATSSNQIPIFDGELYEYWSAQMEPIFISQDLWDIVQEGYEYPQDEDEDSKKRAGKQTKEYKENAKQNASALRIIQRAVSKSIYPRIYGIKKAKEAWDVLRKQFQGSEKSISIRRQSLWRQFDNLMMKEIDTIKDFHSRVAETVN